MKDCNTTSSIVIGCIFCFWLLLSANSPVCAEHPPPRDATAVQPEQNRALTEDPSPPAEGPDDPFAGSLDDPFADDPFAEDAADLHIPDPFEGLNRGIFWFNDKFYFYLFKPVARGWRVFPEPARQSVNRAFYNIGSPVRMINSLLQLRLAKTARVVGRFAVNSTIGLLGLFDPADSWLGWKREEEDFGQTLGQYGAGPGFYLVLPFLGPSNLRDGIGLIGDIYTYPISSPFIAWHLDFWQAVGVESVRRVNQLSLDKETYEGIKLDSLDPYLEIRNGYTQRREMLIKE